MIIVFILMIVWLTFNTISGFLIWNKNQGIFTRDSVNEIAP
ncbi:hypothetical protein MuYL_1874 [Mucilaginibacter xinganensis]|uniref:Uncharacterized protein n=1 Tax=Mucilaginibacter xinganensis TaxID=1234841 RepID=A0A223NVH4_9SPHI|nr:hypothetical protein MuYL_1874 [Mucilaginibacter xinganensis]